MKKQKSKKETPSKMEGIEGSNNSEVQTGSNNSEVQTVTNNKNMEGSKSKSPSVKDKKNTKVKKVKPQKGANNVQAISKPKTLGQESKTAKADGLDAAALKKIEKKKAKKLAQKLKKAQRKELQRQQQQQQKGQNQEQKKAKIDDSSTTTTVKDAIEPIAEHVLKKKERKTKKRQLLKEQKLAEKSIRDPATDEATVFVGNLPVNTKRVQLIRLFQKYGPVNSIRLRSAGGKILHKHKMRKAAGSLNAYVVLKDKSAAENALELNGTEFKGNHLRITKSTKQLSNQELSDEAKRTIFVGNLKYSVTEESLRETFTSCGEVEYVRCIRDGDKGCKGVAYVRFKSADAVGLALELNETILDERPINVERYSVKKLGAKEQRDAEAAKKKNVPKAKQAKTDKSKKAKPGKDNKKSTDEESKKAKKSEFRGVKVDTLKQKYKMKKKKSKHQVLDLVKKIAPKPKN